MKPRLTPFLLLVAALAIGCKSGGDTSTTTADNTKPPADAPAADAAKPADSAGANTVVGTWTNDSKDMAGSVVEFKDDGTAHMTGTPDQPKNTTAEADMKYKIDGDKMTETMTMMHMAATDAADEKTKKEVEQMDKMVLTPEAIAKQPPQVDTIKWIDKDTFSLTGKGEAGKEKVTTFKRKV